MIRLRAEPVAADRPHHQTRYAKRAVDTAPRMAGEIEYNETDSGEKMTPRPCSIDARVEWSYAVSAETYGSVGDGADPLRVLRQAAECVPHTTARKQKGDVVDPTRFQWAVRVRLGMDMALPNLPVER
jgi:hypothetical protein